MVRNNPRMFDRKEFVKKFLVGAGGLFVPGYLATANEKSGYQFGEVNGLMTLPLEDVLIKPCEKEVQEALELMRYYNGPSKYYSGKLYDSNKVRILYREGNKILRVRGQATHYSTKTASKKTATGMPLNDNMLGAAINLRLGHKIPALFDVSRIDPKTKKRISKIVRVIAMDYGPFYNDLKTPHKTRLIDLTEKSRRELNISNEGIISVEINYVGQLKLA